MSKQNSRESRRQRLERERRAQQQRKRRIRVAAIAVGVTLGVSGGSPATPAGYAPLSSLGALKPAPAAGPLGPEAVPIPGAPALASVATAATGSPVDGISCQTSEQTLFHIHAHLTIFVNGAARQVPAAIGIPGAVAQQTQTGPFIGSGTCFYWLHTHAADGIVHIESPVQRTYTLVQFFDEWGQPLGPDVVGPAHGHVTVLVNGKVFTGNPRDVPLTDHTQIQLEVGTPLVAPESISWASTGL